MNERWKPEIGQHYWCVQYTGDAVCFQWMNTDFQRRQLEVGNVFPTFDEATQACDLFKAMLLDLKVSNDSFKEAEQYSEHNNLSDWFKVGEWVAYYEDRGYKYFKIAKIELNRLYSEDGKFSLMCDVTQARLRPYNADEMKALVGKVIEQGDDTCVVVHYSRKDGGTIFADGYTHTANELMESGYTINGEPCGVLEHLDDKGEWVK